jgi:hypothetical protein
MKRNERTKIADYVGLKVQVIDRLDHCSLICFKGQTFIVETADLNFDKAFRQAA